MASPFSIFRKYQKTLLVIAGVVLMFVFVIGDSLMQWVGASVGRGQTAEGLAPTAVAVRWNDGQLTNQELGRLTMRRRIVKGFLERVYELGARAAMDAGADPRIPIQVELVAGAGQPDMTIEQSVLQTRLFADAARRLGMVVSDESIRDYLTEVGRGRVSADDMRGLLLHSQFGGGRIPIDYIFQALREELLARNYIASYQYAFDTILPQQRWQDWLRVNDRVVAEVAAIPARQFVVDVRDPSPDELATFFAKYKDREPMPDVVDNTVLPSPTPGFATPQRVQVQYLKADYNDFITRLSEQVTDEEIKNYYEENKALFVRADADLTDVDLTDQGQQTEQPSFEPESDETLPQEEGSTGSADHEDNLDAGQLDGNPADEVDVEEATVEDVEEEEEEEEEEEADVEVEEDETVDLVNDPADENDATSTQGEQNQDDQTEKDEEKPVEYQPLDDVREEIRMALAQQKVADRIDSIVDELYGKLKSAHTSWEAKVFDAQDAGENPPPPPPELSNLEGLAQESGLEFQKTDLLSFLELQDTPIGSSGNPNRFGRASLAAALMQELELYEPAMSYDLDGNRYLAVKVEDVPGEVPELDEIRGEVIRAWKLRQAAELALKHAEELAAKVQDSGLPLAEYFADDNTVTAERTGPFSWLTAGSAAQMTGEVQFFRLSEPYGVVGAGPAFMREVFGLGSGEVGAVLNHDQSIAFVVRVVEHLQSLEELQQSFLDEADYWSGLRSMTQLHNRQAAQALMQDLFAATGVDWLRPPDQQPPE